MTDELKQWEYDKGYTKGYSDGRASLIEELEKIKDEIGNECVDIQDGSEEWRSYVNDAVLSCYEIIEKHISELKENKKGVLESIAEEQKTLLDTTKAWSNYIDKHGDIY